MTRARQDRLVDLLVRDGGWRTASDLADRLGVTSRSIRSYVAAVNERAEGHEPIESGALGYRVRADRVAELQLGVDDGPDARRTSIARTLAAAATGRDVFAMAEQYFVSGATIESDLAWVRSRAAERSLRWERRGSSVMLVGEESARRAFLGSLLRGDTATGYDEVAVEAMLGEGTIDRVRALRAHLSTEFSAAGFFVNEFALAGASFAIALAAWRIADGATLDAVSTDVSPSGLVGIEVTGSSGLNAPGQAADATIASIVGLATSVTLLTVFPPAEIRALVALLRQRGVLVESGGAPDEDDISRELREITDRVTARFGVAPLEDDVLARLVAHIQNLQRRSSGGEWSRNPLTRTLKASYPLLFDVAVALATSLYERFGIPVHDDEVAYLAMHIGGSWERQRALENRLTVTLVCPGYYEMHELLRTSIEQSLGSVIVIADVETGVENNAVFSTDLVLSTIENGGGENTVLISPFFTDLDAEKVMAAVARIRRARRLAHLRAELGRYFVADAFIRPLPVDSSPEGIIRQLGALLVADGVIDDAYVDSAVARERASSTAFTETLAVPHGEGMTASRTAIAIGIADSTIPWGDARVQVVALIAFSEHDREAFQTVFEQFVEVFSEPANTQRIVRRAGDLGTFVEQLAAVIEG